MLNSKRIARLEARIGELESELIEVRYAARFYYPGGYMRVGEALTRLYDHLGVRLEEDPGSFNVVPANAGKGAA